jgi:hypothetical protein
VASDSDSDVSQSEWDKMYEGTGEVGMGRGVAHESKETNT